eukprot:224163_1
MNMNNRNNVFSPSISIYNNNKHKNKSNYPLLSMTRPKYSHSKRCSTNTSNRSSISRLDSKRSNKSTRKSSPNKKDKYVNSMHDFACSSSNNNNEKDKYKHNK